MSYLIVNDSLEENGVPYSATNTEHDEEEVVEENTRSKIVLENDL